MGTSAAEHAAEKRTDWHSEGDFGPRSLHLSQRFGKNRSLAALGTTLALLFPQTLKSHRFCCAYAVAEATDYKASCAGTATANIKTAGKLG